MVRKSAIKTIRKNTCVKFNSLKIRKLITNNPSSNPRRKLLKTKAIKKLIRKNKVVKNKGMIGILRSNKDNLESGDKNNNKYKNNPKKIIVESKLINLCLLFFRIDLV
ncbi:MAG: hypothetical protein M1268_01805 [Patescibacteria group bacterium]|nr:hypothetical protein [Patescibacteria group bacterium]